MERQLTSGPLQKDLDDNLNFSPDGQWIAFDCRPNATGIGANTRLGMVNVRTGEIRVVYEQQAPSKGVGAVSFLNEKELIAIHALDSGIPYDFTARGGKIIPIAGGEPRWLDSRDLSPPFTPGALRGGTHKHEPDKTGRWVGFTYNDHIMKTRNSSDLRNVGVSLRGKRVAVDRDARGENSSGESFSVLLTTAVDHPRPGSDDYQRADGDCWVGADGFKDGSGRLRRARAFRGAVAEMENGAVKIYPDVFIADVPEDITVPGSLGPLEGTETDYPKPPKGATVRRLTRTSSRKDVRLRGISGHLRATGDGKWIAYLAKALRNGEPESQLFVVSPATGKTRQLSDLPGGVIGNPRFSPDSQFVACVGADGSIWKWSSVEASWGRAERLAEPNSNLASRLVISPDGRTIAFNRSIDGVIQIFVIEMTR